MIYDAEKNTIDGKPLNRVLTPEPYEKSFKYPNAFNALIGAIFYLISFFFGAVDGAISDILSVSFGLLGFFFIVASIYHFLKGTYSKK